MSEAELLAMLVGAVPKARIALEVLGGLVVIGQVVVVMTPSKKDDEAMAKAFQVPILGGILKAVCAFAPIQKKAE